MGVVGSARVVAFGVSGVAPAGSVVAGMVILVSYAGFASPLVPAVGIIHPRAYTLVNLLPSQRWAGCALALSPLGSCGLEGPQTSRHWAGYSRRPGTSQPTHTGKSRPRRGTPGGPGAGEDVVVLSPQNPARNGMGRKMMATAASRRLTAAR